MKENAGIIGRDAYRVIKNFMKIGMSACQGEMGRRGKLWRKPITGKIGFFTATWKIGGEGIFII